MKRSHQLNLGLVGVIPLALTACSPQSSEAPVTGTLKKTYESVQSCVDDTLPVDVCADAYMQALSEHRRIAPNYGEQADCEADFVAGYCDKRSDGLFVPKLGGFEIAANYSVPQSQAAQVASQASSSSSSGALLAGLVLGQMMGGGGGRYYSQPVYRYRNSQNKYARSTLSRAVEEGKTFQRSTQVASGARYTASTKGSITSGLKRPTTINTEPAAVRSASRRGGFGSQAAARSGWGSSGGSRSSFGG